MKKLGSIFLALSLLLSCVYSVHAQLSATPTLAVDTSNGVILATPFQCNLLENTAGPQSVISWDLMMWGFESTTGFVSKYELLRTETHDIFNEKIIFK